MFSPPPSWWRVLFRAGDGHDTYQYHKGTKVSVFITGENTLLGTERNLLCPLCWGYFEGASTDGTWDPELGHVEPWDGLLFRSLHLRDPSIRHPIRTIDQMLISLLTVIGANVLPNGFVFRGHLA